MDIQQQIQDAAPLLVSDIRGETKQRQNSRYGKARLINATLVYLEDGSTLQVSSTDAGCLKSLYDFQVYLCR
jgi:hypothetical protein